MREGVVLTKASVLKIGETLDAGLLVYGSFRVEVRPGGKAEMSAPLKITLHTIDLKNMRSGKDLEHNGTLADLSLMQSHMAWMLLKQLAPESTVPEEVYLRSRPAVRLDAMESYVRGLMAVAPQLRIKFFGQAVKLDDHFSQAQFQLGRLEFQN